MSTLPHSLTLVSTYYPFVVKVIRENVVKLTSTNARAARVSTAVHVRTTSTDTRARAPRVCCYTSHVMYTQNIYELHLYGSRKYIDGMKYTYHTS
jgi:hypothetical protein